jgi:DNA-binding NarL/FixJ family response regulator
MGREFVTDSADTGPIVWHRATKSPRIRILVVDDHEVVRRQLCRLLKAQPDMEVISEASDGKGAIHRADEFQPDVILLDIGLPGLDGFTTARHMRAVAPNAEILFVSQHDTMQMVREALRAGGRGYVVKVDAISDLIPAVHAVSEKKQFISARLAEHH